MKRSIGSKKNSSSSSRFLRQSMMESVLVCVILLTVSCESVYSFIHLSTLSNSCVYFICYLCKHPVQLTHWFVTHHIYWLPMKQLCTGWRAVCYFKDNFRVLFWKRPQIKASCLKDQRFTKWLLINRKSHFLGKLFYKLLFILSGATVCHPMAVCLIWSRLTDWLIKTFIISCSTV